MAIYKVGDRFTHLAGRPEGAFFEISESGPVWIFHYNKPSEKEIAAISEGSPFEIRSTVLGGTVLWVFVKCGSQEWAEAPYNPHLSKSPSLPPIESDGDGYALTLLMVDAATQVIRHMRLIGLGNRFSRQLWADIQDLLDKPFDAHAHTRAISATQWQHSTPQLVKMCRNIWKLR
jgi:hypothetical protein